MDIGRAIRRGRSHWERLCIATFICMVLSCVLACTCPSLELTIAVQNCCCSRTVRCSEHFLGRLFRFEKRTMIEAFSHLLSGTPCICLNIELKISLSKLRGGGGIRWATTFGKIGVYSKVLMLESWNKNHQNRNKIIYLYNYFSEWCICMQQFLLQKTKNRTILHRNRI